MNILSRKTGRQAGMTMAISLILLLLVTILIVTAMYLATTNIRSVANMQFRERVIDAANAQIEEIVASNFSSRLLVLADVPLDIDRDGRNDALVDVRAECIQATVSSDAPRSSVSLPVSMSSDPTWSVTWDVSATADDPDTGASVVARSGVRVLMSDAEKRALCDPLPSTPTP